jgi:hypothetical protein
MSLITSQGGCHAPAQEDAAHADERLGIPTKAKPRRE